MLTLHSSQESLTVLDFTAKAEKSALLSTIQFVMSPLAKRIYVYLYVEYFKLKVLVPFGFGWPIVPYGSPSPTALSEAGCHLLD